MTTINTALDQILMPRCRRVYPGLVFNDTTLPKWLQPGRNEWCVDPAVYRSFLRLNNRRRTQCDQDFITAGYFSVSGPHPQDAVPWCRQQFGQHGYCLNPVWRVFWFADQAHAVEFSMVWL